MGIITVTAYDGSIQECQELTASQALQKMIEGNEVIRIINKQYCGEFKIIGTNLYYKGVHANSFDCDDSNDNAFNNFLRRFSHVTFILNPNLKKTVGTIIYLKDLNRQFTVGEKIYFKFPEGLDEYRVIEAVDDVLALTVESRFYDDNKTLKQNFDGIYFRSTFDPNNFFVIEEKEVVEVLGKSYLKEELEKALKTIKPIK